MGTFHQPVWPRSLSPELASWLWDLHTANLAFQGSRSPEYMSYNSLGIGPKTLEYLAVLLGVTVKLDKCWPGMKRTRSGAWRVFAFGNPRHGKQNE